MPTANERQHGGDHYKKMSYEHWDFVCDTGQPYLIACATKYASRWRNKGGHVDLEKMIHYLDKADERSVKQPELTPGAGSEALAKFILQLEQPNDRALVAHIMNGNWQAARDLARALMRGEV